MGELWGIILAAGNGSRVASFIQKVGGKNCPKQFFAFTGRRTMFQHTFDRVERMISPSNILTVVGRDHIPYVEAQVKDRSVTTVIFQPRNCDTLPGILLPLVYVLKRDPAATIAVFPSDHFILDELRFLQSVQWACKVVDRCPDRLVLLGVKPNCPEPEYGWIEPGEPFLEENGNFALTVSSFHEKPGLDQGNLLLKKGCLWNTLVFVAKAAAFYNLARSISPQIVVHFDELLRDIGTADELQTLEHIYTRMESLNVSRDLFEKSPHGLLLVPVMETGWSDWGREERILTTLQRHEGQCHVHVSKLYPEAARGVSKRENSPSGRYEDHPE